MNKWNLFLGSLHSKTDPQSYRQLASATTSYSTKIVFFNSLLLFRCMHFTYSYLFLLSENGRLFSAAVQLMSGWLYIAISSRLLALYIPTTATAGCSKSYSHQKLLLLSDWKLLSCSCAHAPVRMLLLLFKLLFKRLLKLSPKLTDSSKGSQSLLPRLWFRELFYRVD